MNAKQALLAIVAIILNNKEQQPNLPYTLTHENGTKCVETDTFIGISHDFVSVVKANNQDQLVFIAGDEQDLIALAKEMGAYESEGRVYPVRRPRRGSLVELPASTYEQRQANLTR
jgi:hypothetical protein